MHDPVVIDRRATLKGRMQERQALERHRWALIGIRVQQPIQKVRYMAVAGLVTQLRQWQYSS